MPHPKEPIRRGPGDINQRLFRSFVVLFILIVVIGVAISVSISTGDMLYDVISGRCG